MHTGLKILKFICFVLIKLIFLVNIKNNNYATPRSKSLLLLSYPVLTKKVWSRYNINDIQLYIYIYKHVRFYITWDAADGCSLVLSVYFVFIFIMFNTHSFGPSPNYIIMICIYAYDMIQDMILWIKFTYLFSKIRSLVLTSKL